MCRLHTSSRAPRHHTGDDASSGEGPVQGLLARVGLLASASRPGDVDRRPPCLISVSLTTEDRCGMGARPPLGGASRREGGGH